MAASTITTLLLYAATTGLAECGLVTLNDRGALAMLYWATGGPYWKQSWPINDAYSDPCRDSWYGVHCNFEGNIVLLRLANNGLTGYLPPTFARLSALEELDVSSNALTQSVPATLGRLGALRVLRLDQNALTGVVPPSLSTLSLLEVLRLEGNAFSAPLPTAIYNLQAKGHGTVSWDAALTPLAIDAQ
ncbi:hypothetical protein SDRG_09725 [Saprolegnia diclina VS20]|uniref:Leucine-rich repeat-containing N-terminal plant-type domain-containing protein n=1 Tax=Saprolegnia diclina (strain VS20) TaxID=1156394 RepID=T0RKB3_SAPDV|nr:hypothetical protein SDRG_09725 [Saprolegnia diclina VS20]EQC32753.1 hypothetical protein SDRG_09725 [Saprolegnia diclina VS20]|eukprot:XP_008613897.1 hypothetical protein SDRG_09725 [Saprolegnia diclina VS20]